MRLILVWAILLYICVGFTMGKPNSIGRISKELLTYVKTFLTSLTYEQEEMLFSIFVFRLKNLYSFIIDH